MTVLHEWTYRGVKHRLSKLDDPDMPEELSYLQEEFSETLGRWQGVPMGVLVMHEAALIQSLLSQTEALAEALEGILDGGRVALYSGIVGDYDGAYDTERRDDREQHPDSWQLGETGDVMDGFREVAVLVRQEDATIARAALDAYRKGGGE